MTVVRRRIAVGAVLALAAGFTCSHLWGEPAGNNPNKDFRASGSKPALGKTDQTLTEDLAHSKFADAGLLTYRTAGDELLFALQVKPQLDPAPERPRDYLVMVDTSASKARGPLEVAKRIAETLVKNAAASDRIALWTVNTKARDLTRGFKAPADVQDGLKALQAEYPAGAVSLKDGLSQAVKSFDNEPGRQRVLVFLGDGQSVASPISDDERSQLCQELVKSEVAFFPIPLGSRFDPKNLHGIASGTGGAVVRLQATDGPTDLVKRLKEAVAAPILYPKNVRFPAAEVSQAFPTRLPPLRPDVPTLVVGRLKAGKTLTYTVEGTVAGKNASVTITEKVPEPDVDNFFLAPMVKQWQAAKDQPALMRADRALAYAFEQNQLARADLLAQAEWALSQDKMDVAFRLFDQAREIDPSDVEAKAGVDVVQKLRDGKITKEQLRAQVQGKPDDTVVHIAKVDRAVKVSRERIVQLARADEEPAPADKPLAPAQKGDLLEDARQRQAIEDMHNTQLVDDALAQARRLLPTDPDRAQELLKRTLDSVRNNPDISDQTRATLASRLETSVRNVSVQGARIKLDLEDRQARLAQAQERLGVLAAAERTLNQTVERMRLFHNLMNEGRLEEATRQALTLSQDLSTQGLPVPPAVTAAYVVGLNGNNLRQIQELRRVREDRFLLTMMQVERSHVPFPDEPPVEFPPAATWKAITNLRKEKYESTGFGGELPKRTLQLRDQLTNPVKFGGFDDPKTTLQEALDHLAQRYDLTFDVNETAFKAEMVNDVLGLPVAEKPIPQMFNVSLATVLRKILSRIPVPSGATYIIRRDQIEITTGAFARAEKTTRVYPVADLVFPIPNSVNQRSVQNQATILGNFGAAGGLGALGGGLGALGALGGGLGFGGLGALGGGLGFGALGALGGGLGALGGALGALGGGGVVGAAGQAGFGGQLGFGGQPGNNLGVGGGALGIGGGQLGQFGNLGGQFGLQGGTQEQILIGLIRQVVGSPKDWAPPRGVNLLQQPNAGAIPDDPNADPEGNDLGYFPPAQALIVKGTSRIHTRVVSSLLAPPGAPGMGALDRPNRGVFVQGEPVRDPKNRVAVAANNAEDRDPKKVAQPKTEPKKPVVVADKDPRTMWQDALARGVQDPGLIIAVADYLVEHKEFNHAAEFLKANLRQGLVIRPWVYEALALSLKESKASPDEIERAEVSAVDLEPLDAQGYLRAARVMKDNNRYDRAVAFCRQAAMLEPNTPHAYADALVYAKLGKDADGMEWAAGNLVGRDWQARNEDLHTRALAEMKGLTGTLEGGDRKAIAERLLASVTNKRQRDVVIRLKWEGEADLDLKVKEPNGSVCWCLNRQTIGGGTLLGDLVGEKGESYVAAEAFSGEYQVSVERVWGKPVGDKAKLVIVLHEGTARETMRDVTLDLKAGSSITVKLDDGRRTSLADALPVRPDSQAEAKPALTDSDRILTRLRNLADPETTGVECGIHGGVGSSGYLNEPKARTDDRAGEQVAYQTKVSPFVTNSYDLTAQAVISADRRYVRLSLSPAFNTFNRLQGSQVPFNNPLIPGGGKLP